VAEDALELGADVEPVARQVERLAVDDRREVLDRRAEQSLGLDQSLLGLFLGRDVEQEALPEGVAVRGRDEHRLVVHPDVCPVCPAEPVIRDEWRSILVRALVVRADRLPVVRVDPIHPEVGRPGPLFGGVSEDLLDGGADVELLGRVVGRLHVDDRRHVVHERLEAFLRLAESRLGLHPLRDVDHDALPDQWVPVRVADQMALVVEPHRPAVRRHHPVLLEVRLARLGRSMRLR